MSKSPKLNLGVIGSGWVSTHRHVPAALKTGLFEILCVASKDRDSGLALSQRIHGGFVCGEPDYSTSEFARVDAVIIGTSPFSHYSLAKSALEAGKHVLVEKPMTLSPEQSNDLVSLSQSKKRVLNIVHNFQYARSSTRLDKLITLGRLGEVRAVYALQFSNPNRRLPEWYEELPLGLFYDESPHLLYLLRHFAGSLDLSSCSITKSSLGLRTPAVVTACFTSERKCPAHVYMNFESPVSEWQVFVHGSKMLGVIDVFRDILVVLPNDGRHVASDITRTSATYIFDHLKGYWQSGIRMCLGTLLYGNVEVVTNFHRAVTTGVRSDGTDALDGLEVNALQHAIINHA